MVVDGDIVEAQEEGSDYVIDEKKNEESSE